MNCRGLYGVALCPVLLVQYLDVAVALLPLLDHSRPAGLGLVLTGGDVAGSVGLGLGRKQRFAAGCNEPGPRRLHVGGEVAQAGAVGVLEVSLCGGTVAVGVLV